MEYLKAFTIGTTGPVWFLHMFLLSLKNKNYYDYSFKAYSLIAPTYYGIMSMLAIYFKKKFNITVRASLFLTSILSIILVTSLNYILSSKYFKPYINYNTKDWIEYIIKNSSRHLIAFNLIIYYFTKYFSEYYWFKVFIITSSIFSYFITYINVLYADSKNKLNYRYETFASFESIIQGFTITISVFLLMYILKINILQALFLGNIIGPFLMVISAYYLNTYRYKNIEWFYYFIRGILTEIIRTTIVYYLLIYLK